MLTTYAGIKAKYYTEKQRCADKFAAEIQKDNAAKASLDASKIFS